MTPFALAWSNLRQQPGRTLISVVGVAFAVLLIFMQFGFFGSVQRTATLLYDKLDFDLLMVSSEYISLAKPGTVPRMRLAQTRAVKDINHVRPLTAVLGLWRNPRPDQEIEAFSGFGFLLGLFPSFVSQNLQKTEPVFSKEGGRSQWSILVLGANPSDVPDLFRNPGASVFESEEKLHEAVSGLARLNTVVMDPSSRREYGDADLWKEIEHNELNDCRVRILPQSINLGTGFGYNGLLLTSESNLERCTGWPGDRVTFGLIKLRKGSDPNKVQRHLEDLLPVVQSKSNRAGDIAIYTRDQIERKEIEFWLTGTAVGWFFMAGVVIALMVGGVFVYQMMAADIARRLPEYATIRALGYPAPFLRAVVFWQGFLLAVIGYLPGLVTSWLCYLFTRNWAGIPIQMTPTIFLLVFALTVIMCMGSALLAVRAVHQANPADLF